jgi:hypothetical protein
MARMSNLGKCGQQAEPGDRVLLEGVIDSVHDGFVMVKVDNTAPHAVPQRYDLVAIACCALEPKGPVPWQRPLAAQ